MALPYRWEQEDSVVSGACRGVDLSESWLDGSSRVILDLGPCRPIEDTTRQAASYRALVAAPVREVAEVLVDGRPAGTIWEAPHRLDLTGALRSGSATLGLLVRATPAGRIAIAPHAADTVARSHLIDGRRVEQQDLDLATDQLEAGLPGVSALGGLSVGITNTPCKITKS